MNATTSTNNATTAEQSLSVWLEMWNTDGEIARRICTDDFAIFFGRANPDGSNPTDLIRGGAEFNQFVDSYQLTRPGFVFTELASAIDGDHGHMLWNVDADGVHLGGIDVFRFAEDGRIAHVWSVTGARNVII
jgi:SnoaL-like domain